MRLLQRRFPLEVRPWIALPALGAGLTLLFLGLGWGVDASLQTGNLFFAVLLPATFVAGDPFRWGLVAAATVAFGAAGRWGTTRPRAAPRSATPAWRRPTFRFYPVTAAFGLFLLVFAVVFLFDASFYGDQTSGGYAFFVYLDYAGLADRPVVTLLGSAVAALGVLFATRYAFASGANSRSAVPRPSGGEARSKPTPETNQAPARAGFQLPYLPPPASHALAPRSALSARQVRLPVGSRVAPRGATTSALLPRAPIAHRTRTLSRSDFVSKPTASPARTTRMAGANWRS